MLVELSVRNLGVIADASLLLGPGATALTGETGAGKTLLVEAIELLLGARSDAGLVRPGADEARVDGRFCLGDEELVLTRVVPRSGRARAYVNGRPATATLLTELGGAFVELHSQHAAQSLLGVAAQRDALDQFGAIPVEPLHAARTRVAEGRERLSALGGDERARAREIDLLRFQTEELAAAHLTDADEEDMLEDEEELLSAVDAHRRAAEAVLDGLSGDGGAAEALGAAVGALAGRRPFADPHDRLRALQAELADVVADLRRSAEGMEADPQRLAEVRARRQLLRQLRRKYGEDLAAVMAFAESAAARLAELEGFEQRAAAMEEELRRAERELDAAQARVRADRADAAPRLAGAIEAHLQRLALPRARVEVTVDGPDGGRVAILLSANPGTPPAPLAKAASGGELARTMLAIHLALLEGGDQPPAVARESPDGALPRPARPTTLVFDEVDAGVGGQAALAVGQALARVATGAQVLVVTHLAQVAAAAHAHVAVRKELGSRSTDTTVHALDEDGRVAELARMLSGHPESEAARRHAAELLAAATAGDLPPATPRGARRGSRK